MLAPMAQIVARLDEDLVAQLDALVEDGVITSRSDGVRQALERLVDEHRRAKIGQQIVEGYLRMPQTDDDGLWSDEKTRAMIAEEPW